MRNKVNELNQKDNNGKDIVQIDENSGCIGLLADYIRVHELREKNVKSQERAIEVDTHERA